MISLIIVPEYQISTNHIISIQTVRFCRIETLSYIIKKSWITTNDKLWRRKKRFCRMDHIYRCHQSILGLRNVGFEENINVHEWFLYPPPENKIPVFSIYMLTKLVWVAKVFLDYRIGFWGQLLSKGKCKIINNLWHAWNQRNRGSITSNRKSIIVSHISISQQILHHSCSSWPVTWTSDDSLLNYFAESHGEHFSDIWLKN